MGSISFTAITDGSAIDASDVNGPLNTIYDDYNGSIDSNNLADNAVTTAKITDANVTTAKIADANVTMPKIINPYKFRVYRNASYTGLADNTVTVIDWDAESFDTNDNFNLTSNQYTVPVTGYYIFDFSSRISGTAMVGASGYLFGGAAGTTELASVYRDQASTTSAHIGVGGVFLCTAGDLISTKIYADTTGTYTVVHGSAATYFSGHLISI